MILGVKNNEVVLVQYDENWKTEFERTKSNLMLYTNLNASRIEHIGSTAIEGIYAKPIIDLLVGVDSLASLHKDFFTQLQQIGFYRLKVERPSEIVCAKFTDETFQCKTHFLHIVEFEKEKWNQLIFFRNFLNQNQASKDAYEQLKRSILKSNSINIQTYTDSKEDFVYSVVEKMKD